MSISSIFSVDSYKASHYLQLPPGTTHIHSYIEARKGGRYDRVLFFGLQAYLKAYLSRTITQADVEEAAQFWPVHGEPFNRAGWEHIVNRHDGRLPLRIRAAREGMVIPAGNALVVVENTDPECAWLTSYVETALLRAVWYPSTVATLSWHCRQIIQKALDETSDDPSQISFKLHDFGARGVSSQESAMLGGMAHLINFMGSDTVEGVIAARRFYGATMAGFSIPAAEHSTITSWGRDHEVDAYRNMLRQFGKPGGLVAVVSDSYDIYNAVQNIWGDTLRQEVIDSGATVVVRPDSGDPTRVPVDIIEMLGEKFGTTTNSKGYRVLPSYVRVIQGDGIDNWTLPLILDNLKGRGFAADNIAFGMGGGLLQQVNRDTLSFAMKASAAKINDEWRDVQKQPVTAEGKRSKAGRLALIREYGHYETVQCQGNDWRDLLVEVFRDGEITKEWTFDEVRENAARPALD